MLTWLFKGDGLGQHFPEHHAERIAVGMGRVVRLRMLNRVEITWYKLTFPYIMTSGAIQLSVSTDACAGLPSLSVSTWSCDSRCKYLTISHVSSNVAIMIPPTPFSSCVSPIHDFYVSYLAQLKICQFDNLSNWPVCNSHKLFQLHDITTHQRYEHSHLQHKIAKPRAVGFAAKQFSNSL